MAIFRDLPIELLLRIFGCINHAASDIADTAKSQDSPILARRMVDKIFWRNKLVQYQDLLHLALTTHYLRPLAQEILFRTSAIDNRERKERDTASLACVNSSSPCCDGQTWRCERFHFTLTLIRIQ
jgi:hypothetical protein